MTVIQSLVGPGSERCLQAVFDELIPPDHSAGGWDGGAETYLVNELPGDLSWAIGALRRATASLNESANNSGLGDFADAPSVSRSKILSAYFAAQPADATTLVRLAMEGFYAAVTPALADNWLTIGFDAVPPGTRAPRPGTPLRPREQLSTIYDTVIIGAGAGGGVAAAILAESGERVLLLERGHALGDADLRGDHLHGKRLGRYSVTAGPGPGNPRIWESPNGNTRAVDPEREPFAWGLNAMCAGGGTRLWQGMAWRFLPEDFAMADVYGVPPDSSLANWPLSYGDMAPHYARVEHELGVSGDSTAWNHRFTDRVEYPMPPIPPDSAGAILDAAARILGWRTGAIPFAINSQQRDGRPECIRCPQCMGHSCPVNAKNGTHNTFIPRALANGNCTLVYAAQALQIRDSTAVSPASVTFATHDCEGTRCLEVSAGRVIVSAGAIETPRLLLASALGNSHVGRHLHAHTIHLGIGELNQELTDFSGPGHSIACLDFAHAGSAPYGGGVIFDAPSQLPLALAEIAPQLGVPAWGPAHKAWMRSGRRRLIGTMTIGQELPHLESSVRVDAKVKDRSGMPVARVHVVPHMANAEVRSFLALRCAEWLAATGAQPGPTLLSGTAMSEHCAGSCRMGHDPTASACGSDGLLHGARHVYVCDASLHPSNGSVNPALTVMANAHRIASALVTQS